MQGDDKICGIVGIADYSNTAVGHKELEIFQQLLITDSARGMDGTGMFKVTRDGYRNWMKIQGHPFKLFEAKGFKTFWEKTITPEWTRFLVGHNRAASRGGVSTDSSHPFESSHIVLVHNGTVTASCDLPELKKFDVDSAAICASIAKRGVQETIDMKIGPFALVWYNSKDKTLNMLRNDGRPLYVLPEKTSHRFIFGSEPGMLEWVGKRNFLYGTPAMVPEHTLLTWGLDDFDPVQTLIKIPKIIYGGWQGGDCWDGFGGGLVDHSEPAVPVYAPKHSVIPFQSKHFNTEIGKSIAQSEEAVKEGTQTPVILSPYKNRPQVSIIAEVYGYKKGMPVQFMIADYIWQGKEQQRALIEGVMEKYHNIEIQGTFYGNGADLDNLQGCDWQEGTIVSIIELLDKVRDDGAPTYRFYVSMIIGMGDSSIDKAIEEDTKTGTGEVPTLDPEDLEATATVLADSGIIVVSGSKLLN